MAIENFNEIKDYFETNKDSDDVKNYVGSLITTDRVNSFLDSDDGKKLIQPKLDQHFTKGLETWKTNNLQKLVDEKYAKDHPSTDPKDEALAKVQRELEDMKAQTAKEKLTNKALKIATDKKLPTALINFFVGADEDTTTKNLAVLEKAFNDSVNSAAADRFKDGKYTPPAGDEKTIFTMDQIKKMSADEINKNWDAVQAVLKNNK